MLKKTAIEIICVLLMILFVYAAVSKSLDIDKFRVQIGNSPMIANVSAPLSWSVPLVEVLIATILAIRKLRLIGLLASYTLMLTFTLYIIIILNFSPHIPCSCGGILENMNWTQHLLFNIAFVAISLIGIVLENGIVTEEQHQQLKDYDKPKAVSA